MHIQKQQQQQHRPVKVRHNADDSRLTDSLAMFAMLRAEGEYGLFFELQMREKKKLVVELSSQTPQKKNPGPAAHPHCLARHTQLLFPSIVTPPPPAPPPHWSRSSNSARLSSKVPFTPFLTDVSRPIPSTATLSPLLNLTARAVIWTTRWLDASRYRMSS